MIDPNAVPAQNTDTQTQAAIIAATDRLIAEAALKNGLTIDQIPQYAKDDARRTAIEMVARENDPNYRLYLDQKRQNEALQAQLAVIQRTPPPAAASARAPITVEQVRRQAGEMGYYMMTETQKIAALGVDPSTVSKVQLKELFGRGSGDRIKQDFANANPALYAKLREVAKIIGLYGG